MHYAQFYHLSTGYVPGSIPPAFDNAHKRPIPACGSDGVTLLDGRLSTRNQATKAREICRARGFVGFSLHAGETFARARETRPLETL